MKRERISVIKQDFDSIVKTEQGVEYWTARELMLRLGYDKWENFESVIKRAVESCATSGVNPDDHFRKVIETVITGKNTPKERADYLLTRYACYLIAQNGDPKKEEIAFAQGYFAVQTRKQELIEERISYIERMEARSRLRESEKQLSKNIYERGVDDAGLNVKQKLKISELSLNLVNCQILSSSHDILKFYLLNYHRSTSLVLTIIVLY